MRSFYCNRIWFWI